MITASSLNRYMLCAASANLQKEESKGKALDWGNAAHLYVANAISPIRGYTIPEDYREKLLAIRVDQLLEYVGSTPLSEHAFAYHPATNQALQLGRILDRDYGEPRGPGWIYMTLDVIVLGTRAGVDIDIKTGRSHGPSGESWQLRVHALALAAACDYKEVRVEHATLLEDGSFSFDPTVFDRTALERFRTELVEMLSRVESKPAPTPSSAACKWCPSYKYCPATEETANALPLALRDASQLTPSQAGATWEDLKRYEKMIDAIRSELQDYARANPFQLPNGKWVKEVEEEGNESCTSSALLLLVEQVGADRALAVAGITKTGIEKAARQMALDDGEAKGGAKVAKEVIQVMREQGAFERKVTKRVKETT